MKILQVTPAFIPSKFGGIKTLSYNLSKALSKRGHQVTVFTTDADLGHSRLKNVKNTQIIDGIDVKYFKNISNLLAWKCHLFLPLGMSWTLRKEIGNFDIVHLHEYRGFLSIVVQRYAKKNGIPYIIQAHGDLPADFGKKRLKQIFDYFWGNSVLKNAKKVIALTTYESNQYMQKGIPEEKIEIIPNGFDFSNFSILSEKAVFRKKYGIELNQKLILFLGRINEIKGIDLLIESFCEVSKEITNSVLVIVGPDDGHLSFLNELIKKYKIQNKTIFTGPLYGAEKYNAYRDADVYVLPSRYEAFPNTVLEAWACGTPVIITDSCALSTIAQQAGIVVKRNPIDLAKAIKRLILDEKMRDKYSKRGQSLVSNEFNIEMVVTKIEKCYQEVILTTKNQGKVAEKTIY